MTPPTPQPGFTLLELTVVLLILVALAGVVIPFTQGTVDQAACQATDATLAAVKEAIMGSGAGPGYYSDMGNRLPYYRDGSGNADCHDDTAAGGDPIYHLHFLFNVSATNSTPKKSVCPKSLQSFRPNLALGWRGPYLQNGGGKLADPAKLDSSFSDTTHHVAFDHKSSTFQNDFHVLDHYRWHNPIVLQVPTSGTCSGYPDPSWCARLVSAGPDGALSTTLANVSATNRGDDRVLFLRIPDPYPQGNLPCARK
ncbi:hypothetical protein MIT9_P2336 [Methylomarinovum caldicuralii]|uniref:Prepilin-type N-terminal cleavage/methylation domain-containing protein n=2 Tax=Methylomarinovum caldicuralii TaxID=438856 RepID=A0AAU9C1Z2_9GAMM|nr:hypothetical protein MIT9_P2336 [Methylomarinovum caldicuralii]